MPSRAQAMEALARRGELPAEFREEYDRLKAGGSIAPKGGFKPMPGDAATKLEEQVTAYAGLDRAVSGFKDDFSGPGSGLENTAQGWLGTGTPGQRDWWADFRSSDNQVRNALFGASLTPGEQASYAGTSITPNMTPQEIRANLSRRRDLAREVLGRRAAFARSKGYEPDAVSAILGQYDPAKAAATPQGGGSNGVMVDASSVPADPMTQLKPEDRQAYFVLERTAKTPGELVGFAADHGFTMTFDNAKAILDSRDQGADLSGRDTILYRPQAPVDAGDGAFGAGLRGAGDTTTFGTLDELGGVVDTLAGKGGDGGFMDRLGRNIDYNRAVMAGDAENHGTARFVGQLAGGLAVPFGAGARTAGQLARVGAIGGAAYGFGSGEGNVLERAPNALAGAGVGALGGYAFGRAAPVVGDALARFRPAPSTVRQEANALAEAGARQDVPMTASDLRPGARNAFAYLEAAPGGAGPTQDALRAGNDALEAAAGRVGGGVLQTQEAIGSTIQDAGRRMIDRTRTIKNDLYGQAERLAGGTSVRSQNAVDVLDRNIAELSETPNANRSLLGLLQEMRDDLVVPDASTGRYTPRGLSVTSIRNLRTAMRGEIGARNLTMTDAERRVSQVIDAASTDIADALTRTDPRAAAAYRQADRYYAERQQYIGQVVRYYMGPRDNPLSGEQAFQRVMSLTGEKGDREKLSAVMRGLNPDERADIASTVAGGLGRTTADGDFSAARFVTQAQKMTSGAREAVFGREGADAINDLIAIATAKRDTTNRLNNSRSGQVSNYDRMLTGALGLAGAGGGYAAGGALGAGVGAAAAAGAKAAALNVSARLLTNPQFVAWLGRAPSNASPAQITAHVQQLSNLAVRQPAIRGELQQLAARLLEPSGGIGRGLAAGEGPDQGNNRPSR